MTQNSKIIFIVDDHEEQAEALALTLVGDDRVICVFSDPIKAVAACIEQHVDLLITDLQMPYMDGEGVIKAARRWQPDLVAFLVSGSSRGAEVAEELGVTFFLKPVDLSGLMSAVSGVLDMSQSLAASN